MELELTEDQKILQTSARSFLKKESPPSLMKEMADDEKGYPVPLWKKMAELGWQGVMVPEVYGGIGGDFLDLCILLEAMGEVCAPGPFFSTVVLGGLTLLEAGSDDQKKSLLPKMAAGECLLALALNEPNAWYDPAGIEARATLEGETYVIEGTKLFVEYAHVADYILCAARAEGGITLFLVKKDTPGVHCDVLETLAYDKQCEVTFDKVAVKKDRVVGAVGKAWTVIEGILEKAAVAKCAEMVGCIQTAFDMTVAYAKEREQFGRPIGSFQAVQHHCANMLMDVDGARFSTYHAAWRIAEGLPAKMEGAMAKAYTSEAARKVTVLAHQIHGAISFCEEHDMHLFYRKAKAGEVCLGDTDFHLERVAQQLGL